MDRIKLPKTLRDINTKNYKEIDAFSWSHSCERLTQMLINTPGPISISINAPWGTGKTFFLNMVLEELDRVQTKNDNDFHRVYFSAWEFDESTDPALPLLSKVNSILSLDSTKNKSLNELVRHVLKNAAKKHMYFDQEKFYDSFLDDLSTFKSKFREMLGNTLRRNKLIILVDELDRCRPDWAVSFLERVKHLFSLPEIIFIFAIDDKQLASSISHSFGERFDSSGYLKRFFDYSFRIRPKHSPNLYKGFIPDSFEGFQAMNFAHVLSSYVDIGKVATRNAIKLAKKVQAFYLCGFKFPSPLMVLLSLMRDESIVKFSYQTLAQDFSTNPSDRFIDLFDHLNSQSNNKRYNIWDPGEAESLPLVLSEISFYSTRYSDHSYAGSVLQRHYKEKNSALNNADFQRIIKSLIEKIGYISIKQPLTILEKEVNSFLSIGMEL
ncbi:MAG: P-loop NTPase fold protein [Acidobacteriota bacterium]|nr:P-loop NTPase fold protein [Acidobacteriota bacterium]